ncbi:hypothetical protein DK847_15275 [Aestuariivirga litoralis]|uniref:Uncharacterized protein n=1 Tax=Aestuariivirga litoralis TaxID=2650924 RepID=A0A2W2AKG3_9HYPH|nr:hypothetical protein DK847_15275 [Aestuariivirga litoralis]
MSLWCPAKKGIVNLYVPRPTPELQRPGRRKLPMTVSAGGETATFAGKVDIIASSPTSSIEVEIPVDSPLLKALEKADRFTVTVNSEQVVFPLYDADVTALLGLCRKS